MRNAAVLAVLVALHVPLSAGSCDGPRIAVVNMERIPKPYRDCFEQVTGPLPKTVPLKTLIEYTAKYRTDVLRLQSCGRQTIAWVDHQMDIYTRMGRRR
jgi:hypothetical protein